MNERRCGMRGRRREDIEPAEFCLEHSGFKVSIESLDRTVEMNTIKLDSFFKRINVLLITMLLGLLGIGCDVIVRIYLGG